MAHDMVFIVIASLCGTTMSFYTHFIVFFSSPIILKQYSNPQNEDFLYFLWFLLPLFCSICGSLAYGYFGDVFGRKSTFTASLLYMGIFALIMGAMPSISAIGPHAMTLIVVVRAIEAFNSAGTYTAALLLVTENCSDTKAQAWFTTLMHMGSSIGTFLAFLTTSISTVCFKQYADYFQWGWRTPFAFLILPLYLSFVVKNRIDETIEFESAIASGLIEWRPLNTTLMSIDNSMNVILVFCLSTSSGILFFTSHYFFLMFLQTKLGF
jgi:MFS family permease